MRLKGMETFAITCTTCRSRLRVRDQTAIGQILACPKCGGMVMVKPPPAFNVLSEQRSDLPTATEVEAPASKFNQTLHSSAFDVLEDLFSDAPPKLPSTSAPGAVKALPATPAQPQAPKPRFVGGPPVHRSATPPVHRSATPPPAQPAKPASTSTAAAPNASDSKVVKPVTQERPARASGGRPVFRDSEPLPPPPPSEAEGGAVAEHTEARVAAPRQNHWLMVAGSVALGIALAVTAVSLAIFYRPRNEAAKKPGVAQEQTVPNEDANTKVVPGPAGSESPASAVVTEQPPAATNVAKAATESSPASDATKPPEVAALRDPLGLVNDANTAPSAVTPSTDSLAKFDNLIGGANNDPLAKSNPPPNQLPSLPPPDTSPPRPQVPRPPAREIDVAKRLADPLPAIETAETPLADFVQLISDLSTIPITLDVPFSPATPQSKVALQLTNTTVGAALAEGLKPLRLEYVIVDGQLIVRRVEPSSVAKFSHDVKDLTGGDEQPMNELAELLKSIVEPGEWDGEGGRGSISVDVAKKAIVIAHRRAMQFAVLLAVEKLRRARTPPLPLVSKLDSPLFTIETRSALTKARLEKPLSLNYSQPTRLLTILDRLSEAAGVQILVDWQDVASAGWNPAAEATLVASNQPLAAALDALLGPLDLTWRIIDGQTLQVVTPQRLAEQGEFELYRVDQIISQDLSGDALAAKVRAALGDAAFRDGGGGGEIRYESESGCLLAWLPQPRQRELEALLTKWRSERAK